MVLITKEKLKILNLKGFDNFEYIRENFGPYFKHKFSKENPVGSQWNYNYPAGARLYRVPYN